MSKDAVETLSKEERKRLKKLAKEQAKKAEGEKMEDPSERECHRMFLLMNS